MDTKTTSSRYRWLLLVLGFLTNALVVAAPSMAMPVLFAEISTDLHLDLVQIGLIWGISSLPSIITVLVGGAIGDRFGPKRILILSCVLVGVSGALRGLSNNFTALSATMILFGVFSPFITMNVLKACGAWFSREQLGLASGVLSMGMAMGFLAGSLLSATVLSPWLGGWRNVLFLLGGIDILLAVPWFFTRHASHDVPVRPATAAASAAPQSLMSNLGWVARIRNVWLAGLVILGVSGCVQGTLGYLPLYLRSSGWNGATADSALAVFHTISLVFVIPIALLSDRLGTRRKVLIAATLLIAGGVSLLAFAQGALVWVAVFIAGMARDGFMAVYLTMIIETEGVGTRYAGTATGLALVFSCIGNVLAPPLGNSLAGIHPGSPFLFWAALTGLGLIGLMAAHEGRIRPVLATE